MALALIIGPTFPTAPNAPGPGSQFTDVIALELAVIPSYIKCLNNLLLRLQADDPDDLGPTYPWEYVINTIVLAFNVALAMHSALTNNVESDTKEGLYKRLKQLSTMLKQMIEVLSGLPRALNVVRPTLPLLEEVSQIAREDAQYFRSIGQTIYNARRYTKNLLSYDGSTEFLNRFQIAELNLNTQRTVTQGGNAVPPRQNSDSQTSVTLDIQAADHHVSGHHPEPQLSATPASETVHLPSPPNESLDIVPDKNEKDDLSAEGPTSGAQHQGHSTVATKPFLKLETESGNYSDAEVVLVQRHKRTPAPRRLSEMSWPYSDYMIDKVQSPISSPTTHETPRYLRSLPSEDEQQPPVEHLDETESQVDTNLPPAQETHSTVSGAASTQSLPSEDQPTDRTSTICEPPLSPRDSDFSLSNFQLQPLPSIPQAVEPRDMDVPPVPPKPVAVAPFPVSIPNRESQPLEPIPEVEEAPKKKRKRARDSQDLTREPTTEQRESEERAAIEEQCRINSEEDSKKKRAAPAIYSQSSSRYSSQASLYRIDDSPPASSGHKWVDYLTPTGSPPSASALQRTTTLSSSTPTFSGSVSRGPSPGSGHASDKAALDSALNPPTALLKRSNSSSSHNSRTPSPQYNNGQMTNPVINSATTKHSRSSSSLSRHATPNDRRFF